MRVAYEAANLIDAHLVRQALEHAGIPAWVRGEALTGGMGELGVFGLVAVMVPESALPAAREVVAAVQAAPGAVDAVQPHGVHHVHGRPITGPFPGMQLAQFGMGCFWGAERRYWAMPGVHTTAVGYAGGHAPNPTYRDVCSGETGHAEVVLVVYDPAQLVFEALLRLFWESHDPTQGMRQGNDVGSQYRSLIHCTTQPQFDAASASRDAYQRRLGEAGFGAITTGIVFPAPAFHYAEDEHQQYLSKQPRGYCGLRGTGVPCPVGAAT